MYDEWFKVFRALPKCPIFRNLSVPRGRCCKIICRELHFVISLQSATFLIGQTAKRYKSYDKNTRQISLLHQPCAACKFLKLAQVKPGELLSSRHTVLVAQW